MADEDPLYDAIDNAVDTDPLKLRDALNAVLGRCNAINSMMFASEVRCLIAEALGVPQAGKP